MAETAEPTRGVPAPVVTRLPLYLTALESLSAAGRATASSEDIGALAGTGAAIVRRDLTHLAPAGRRGVGYDVAGLTASLRTFLRIDVPRRIAIAGAGRLGRALAQYLEGPGHGFSLVAVLDADPALIGTTAAGITVSAFDELAAVVSDREVELLVIAVPAAAAQTVADAASSAGVTGLLNFAPVAVTGPAGVEIRSVDLARELQVLSFYAPPAPSAGDFPAPQETSA